MFKPIKRIFSLGLATVATTLPLQTASALPIQGMPVPELAQFDTLMHDFMENNGIESGLLAIMKDGVIVYQRGFGWKDEAQSVPLRHDAVMRIASITKPFTAAAVQRLYASGALDPNDLVFDVGQPGGGIMPYAAFPSLVDNQIQQITVQNLLSHTSGIGTNDANDPMFREIEIADAFNNADIPTSYPPGRVKTTQWILGQNLSGTPGASYSYSNAGFMVLGQVVEAASGMSHIDFVRNHVMGPMEWMPLNEVVAGRTFPGDRDPREPWYDNGSTGANVFNPDGDNVPMHSGGYHHELHFASGAFVTSSAALVQLAEMYYVQAENRNAGLATTYGALTNGVRSNRSHGGLLWGTESRVQSRTDGVNWAVVFNKGGPGTNWSGQFRTLMNDTLDAGGISWPTQGVEGQWVQFGGFGLPGSGAYENPWRFFQVALSQSPDEATLNFKPGQSSWTGVINQKIRLRAPEGGAARIGQQ